MLKINVNNKFIRQKLDRKKYMQEPMCSAESATRRCSVKKVFLEISQNSPENTCARVSFST